jgi:hypothetical protein
VTTVAAPELTVLAAAAAVAAVEVAGNATRHCSYAEVLVLDMVGIVADAEEEPREVVGEVESPLCVIGTTYIM